MLRRLDNIEGSFSFVSLLKACGKKKDIQKGIQLHAEIVKKGLLGKCPYVATTLISMYAKCGEFSKAQQVFEELPTRTASSWNALLSLYAQQGQGHEALHCLQAMQRDGFAPDSVSFTCILKACGKIKILHRKCKQIHDEIVRSGLLREDVILGTALVDMYVQCGELDNAKEMIQELPIQNVVAWNALIAGYAKNGQGHEALSCFERMQSEAILPDAVTFISILKACSAKGVMDERVGKRINRSVDETMDKGGTDKGIDKGLVEKVMDKGIDKRIDKITDKSEIDKKIDNSAIHNGINKRINKYIDKGIGNGLYKGIDMGIDKCVVKSIDKCAIDKDINKGIHIGAINKGIHLHVKIVNSGTIEKDIVVGTALAGMYAKCGELLRAYQVLEGLPVRNVVSWSALLSGCVQHGQSHKALNCFEQMLCEGIPPDAVTYICILKACGIVKDVDKGKEIHDEIMRKGMLVKDIVLGNALVDMYAKCGALPKARKVLQELRVRDVVSWNALIGGYSQQEQCYEAIKCFEWMQTEGVSPDAVTFICILKACGSIGAINKGKEMHALIISIGMLDKNIELGNTLVDMYVKCREIEIAQKVLGELPSRDAVSWNVLISGYVQKGEYDNALNCFEWMQTEDVAPDVVTFIYILKACDGIGYINKGKQIHDMILNRGYLGEDIVLGNVLIDLYAKSGMFIRAEEAFNELVIQDTVSWNSLIAGYTQHGQCHEALNCFVKMQIQGFCPDAITFLSILKACGTMRDIDKGKQIHGQIVNDGMLENNIVLANALVDMYAKCGLLTKAQEVFEELSTRDIITWNALITGYAQEGLGNEALSCFENMQSEGICPNTITFVCILKACGSIGAIDKGNQIHDEVVRRGFIDPKNVILGNALIDMYTKCDCHVKAAEVLECLPISDVISWSTLMAAYAQRGQGHETLNCFGWMLGKGISPNEVTFICILKACASIGAIDKGKEIHDEIVCRGLLDKDIMLGNVLVDMYAKCGVLTKSKQVLELLPIRNVISWNTLIAGYAQQGQGYEALKCLVEMQKEGLSPNEVTFLSVLRSCSHSGLLELSEFLFGMMTRKYDISPSLEHHTCMVAIFGCAGYFDKAMSVIDAMPSCDDELAMWLSLLGSCRKWGNLRLGRLAFSRAIEVDSGCSAAYILMGNIFVSFGMQKDVENVEAMRLKYVTWK